MSLLGLAVLLFGADDPHSPINPVYRELRERGAIVSGDKRAKAPAPTMADGLDAKTQGKILADLVGQDYSLEDFTRDSVVAPHLYQSAKSDEGDAKAPVTRVDFWFVAYGSLNAAAKKDFFERLFQNERKDGAGRALTEMELKERSISIPPSLDDREAYGSFAANILDRVELSGVGRTVWSRTPDSLVVAGLVDHRFAKDAKFPNIWRPLERHDDGDLKPGTPHPYLGAAFVMKLTRLAEPAGALFVEGHLFYVEPVGWFDGANLLGAKLPTIIEGQVRQTRRELLKAK